MTLRFSISSFQSPLQHQTFAACDTPFLVSDRASFLFSDAPPFLNKVSRGAIYRSRNIPFQAGFFFAHISRRRPMPSRNHLACFDVLPANAIVRVGTVAGLFGCSESTIWRSVQRGDLPRPVRSLGRTTGWPVGSLRKALRQRAKAQND